tara:strand:+ start:1546 stop:2025 length:480 start_codon:yes stop_codon:yes gene_type:complete
MNQIQTKTCFNKFSGDRYYIITVDGVSLEDIVLKNRPDILEGLVPTLLNWLEDPEERKEVWLRSFPDLDKKELLPILMCEEDIDFSCTLIIAEVTCDDNFIYWNKFGLEDSDAQTPGEIGKSVMWFDEVKPMKFTIADYSDLLNKFRKNLKLEGEDSYK